MLDKLEIFREQIDTIDKKILRLIASRLRLVEKIGEIKKKSGLPVYIPEREASVLAELCKEAKCLGLMPSLVEDVFRRVMYESYFVENKNNYNV